MSTSVLWDLRNVSIPETCRFVPINPVCAFCKHGAITEGFWAHDAALESGSSVIVFLKALRFFISQPVASACNGTSSRSYIHMYIPNSTWSPIKSYLEFWMYGTKDAHLPVGTSHMQPSQQGLKYICLWILQKKKKIFLGLCIEQHVSKM